MYKSVHFIKHYWTRLPWLLFISQILKVKDESSLPCPQNQNFWHNACLRNWRASPYNINPALYSRCALESYPMHIYVISALESLRSKVLIPSRVYHRIPHGLWQLTNAIWKEKLGLLRMILWKRLWWIFAQDWNVSWTKKGAKLIIGSRIKDSWEGSLKFLQFIFIDVFMVTCEFHWVSTMFKQKSDKLILGTIFFGPPCISYKNTNIYPIKILIYILFRTHFLCDLIFRLSVR